MSRSRNRPRIQDQEDESGDLKVQRELEANSNDISETRAAIKEVEVAIKKVDDSITAAEEFIKHLDDLIGIVQTERPAKDKIRYSDVEEVRSELKEAKVNKSQLRAKESQLRAKESQLRAEMQQLREKESQLRAEMQQLREGRLSGEGLREVDLLNPLSIIKLIASRVECTEDLLIESLKTLPFNLSVVLGNFEDEFGFKIDGSKVTGTMIHSLSAGLENGDISKAAKLFSEAKKPSPICTSTYCTTVSEKQLSENAFSCQYYRDEITASLVKHAEWCLERWDRTKYFAPYAAIHNASMMGKSRCVSDLYKWGVFTVSISLQSKESANLPERTPFVADWLTEGPQTNSTICTQRFSGMLIEVIIYLNEWLEKQDHSMKLSELAELWKDEQKSKQFWSTIILLADDYPQLIDSGVQRDATTRGLTLSSNSDAWNNFLLARMQDAHEITVSILEKFKDVENKRKEFGFPQNNKRASVIFVFDEARKLLSLDTLVERTQRFRLLRRALQILPDAPHGRFFAYVMDTTSQMSNLAPSKYAEPSLRARLGGTDLFKPYWWLPSLDVWPKCRMDHTVSQLAQARLYSIFGRPGLHSCFEGLNDHGRMEPTELAISKAESYLINLLQVKILAQHREDGEMSQEQALAIVGIRTSLHVAAGCKMASTLSASHMRMCVGVSDDRDSVYTFQAAEPALAVASARLNLRYGWKPILRHLQDSTSATYTDAGYRGELGAQILLLMAADRLGLNQIKGNYQERKKLMLVDTDIHLIPLFDFLKVILGPDVCKRGLKKKTKNMYIRLTQFVQMYCAPTIDHFIAMFQRAGGIVCKYGYQHADLMLPVIIKEPGQDPIPSEHNITVVLFQIKCNSKALGLYKIIPASTLDLQRDKCTVGLNPNLDYISIILDLGNHVKAESKSSSKSTTPSDTPTQEKKLKIDEFFAERIESEDVATLTGYEQDPDQTSFSAEYLRPSNILHPDDPECQILDDDFSALMTTRYDPLKLKSSSDESLDCLKLSINSLYEGFKR